jgi:hypothetical protein
VLKISSGAPASSRKAIKARVVYAIYRQPKRTDNLLSELKCHSSEVKKEIKMQCKQTYLGVANALYTALLRRVGFPPLHNNNNITDCAQEFFFLVSGTPGVLKLVLTLCGSSA